MGWKEAILISQIHLSPYSHKKPGKTEHPNDGNGADLNLYEVGTVGRIFQLSRSGTNRYSMLIQGVCRFRFKRQRSNNQIFHGRGRDREGYWSARRCSSESKCFTFKANSTRTLRLSETETALLTKLGAPTREFLNTISNLPPGRLADVLTGTLEGKVAEKYEILREANLKDRCDKAFAMLQKQVEVLKISKKIQNQVEGNLKNSQREYYLRQQLKAIQKELGEGKDEGDVDEIKMLKERLEAMPLPLDARKVVTRELKRIGGVCNLCSLNTR